MPEQEVDVRDLLVKENDGYRKLHEEHQGCEERLDALNGKVFLSDQEKHESVRLKKEKLRLKDQMAEIAREYLESNPDGIHR
jgi:uncharacterized protein YdcH (DUF465 family)